MKNGFNRLEPVFEIEPVLENLIKPVLEIRFYLQNRFVTGSIFKTDSNPFYLEKPVLTGSILKTGSNRFYHKKQF